MIVNVAYNSQRRNFPQAHQARVMEKVSVEQIIDQMKLVTITVTILIMILRQFFTLVTLVVFS